MKPTIQETSKWYAVARASKTAMRFKCKHETREDAEAEAIRLAEQPDKRQASAYYVIECIGKVKVPKVVKING